MRKRFLATFLALCMVLGMLPATALAEEIQEMDTPYVEISPTAQENDGGEESLYEEESGIATRSRSAYPVTGGNIFFDAKTGTITDCDKSVTKAIIPRTINGISVTSIGNSAFRYCSNLTSINIPNGVISIGSWAFGDCGSLTSINIPASVTSIGNLAFSGCSSLTSAGSFGGGYNYEFGWATEIPAYAFHGCRSLRSITIPDGVTSIGDAAFGDCSSLTSINIPASVTSIGNLAFFGCSSLTSITIPDGVTSIGNSAFQYCSLTSIIIPASVTSIEFDTFRDCSCLRTITILDGISSIGCGAFEFCNNLTSITIPASVTSIGGETFYACSGLKDVYYAGNETQWKAISIEVYNEELTSATIHYNSTGPDIPTPSGGDITITAMDFGDLTINNFGTATAYFRATDKDGGPLQNITLQYRLKGQDSITTVTTDKNGLFGITTPHLKHNARFTAIISSPDTSTIIQNSEQLFDVEVKQLSYTQAWDGVFNFGIGLGAQLGPGATVGAAELDLNLASIAAAFDTSHSISVEDEYDNGKRTLTLNSGNELGGGLELASGITAKLDEHAKIKPVGISGKGTYLNQIERGLQINDYDPNNKDDLKKIGLFALSVPVTASRSSYLNKLLEEKDLRVCNIETSENGVNLSGGIDLIEVEIGPYSHSLTNEGMSTTWKFKDSYNYAGAESIFSTSKSLKTDINSGIGSPSVEIGITAVNLDDYIIGAQKSNSKQISASRKDNSKDFDSISYKVYKEGEVDYPWMSTAIDTYSTVTFEGDAAKNIFDSNPDIRDWASGRNYFIDIQDTIDYMRSSGNMASVTQMRQVKEARDLSIPLEISLGPKLSLSFDLSGAHSLSWNDRSGILFQNGLYATSISDVSQKEINSVAIDLESLISEAAKTILPDIQKMISYTADMIKKGIVHGLIKISGVDPNWYAVISTVNSRTRTGLSSSECYAIVSLLSEQDESNATLTATLGEPYLITVYADESQTTEVADEELAANPLTLTLQYTADMLENADATPDADVMLFRFDNEKNVYVRETNAIIDKENMVVTAEMTKSGEYILAVNSIIDTDTCIPGDLNGDGKVTMADVMRLARGAAGYVILTAQEQKAGDVTGDGKITMADVIRLARYAAGYSPSL